MSATENTTSSPSSAAGKSLSVMDATELRFLEAKTLRFCKDGATLRLTIADDRTVLKVSIVKAFPFTQSDRHFSIRDGGGKEVGLLTALEGLDPESLALVNAELERRYTVPAIRRIVDVLERFGTVDWDVDTDRGRRKFTTRELRETILRFPDSHYVISDVENNRYEVRRLTDLDSRSQAFLMRHL